MKPQNLLDFIPVKICDWEDKNDGKVVVKKPKYHNRVWRRIMINFSRSEFYKVNLDQFGSHVWRAIDGKKNVCQLSESLLNEFGDKVNPVYDRVGQFIRSLQYSQLIRLEK